MNKELIEFVAEHAQVLSTTPAAKQATAAAARAWLDAQAAGEDMDTATTKLLDYLEGKPNTIDAVIAFAQGPAVQMMGEDAAKAYLEKQLERKSQGAKYCDCPACTAATQILARFGRIEL